MGRGKTRNHRANKGIRGNQHQQKPQAEQQPRDVPTRTEYEALRADVDQVRAQQQAEQSKPTKRNPALLVAIGALVVSVISALGTVWQAREARRSVDAAAENFISDQRPWLVVTGAHVAQLGPDKEIFIDFLLTNVGKTPASDITFRRRFSWRAPLEADLQDLVEASVSDVAPGAKRTYRFAVTPGATQGKFAALQSGTLTFSVVGEFVYASGYDGTPFATPVCVSYEARVVPLLNECTVGNRAMR
jgi:hypothetical protein